MGTAVLHVTIRLGSRCRALVVRRVVMGDESMCSGSERRRHKGGPSNVVCRPAPSSAINKSLLCVWERGPATVLQTVSNRRIVVTHDMRVVAPRPANATLCLIQHNILEQHNESPDARQPQQKNSGQDLKAEEGRGYWSRSHHQSRDRAPSDVSGRGYFACRCHPPR